MSTQFIYNLTDTWNNAGTVFTAIKMNVTDTASNASSALLDLQVAGVSQFKVSKAGAASAPELILTGAIGVAAPAGIHRSTDADRLIIAGGDTTAGGGTAGSRVVLFGDAHASTPSVTFYDATTHIFRDSAGSATATMTLNGVAVPTISSTDTLTNKTLSSPTLSGTVAGSATFSSTQTFSTRLSVDTLTVGRGGQTAVASNTAVGYQALNSASLTGTNNVGVGYNVLFSNTTGSNNSAVGVQTLYANTTGNNNSAIGENSLRFNTTGASNTAVGVNSLYTNTTGNNNSAVGVSALFLNTTGANNIAIGYQAGDAITTGSTNIVIGYDIDVDSATDSNQINIGDRYFHNRLRLVETTDPAAPAADNAIIFCRDNGSGKTQICVRFPTGAVQVLATEP